MNQDPQATLTRRLALALACGLALAPSAWSQTTQPTPSEAAGVQSPTREVPVEATNRTSTTDDKLVLSPFVVTTQKDSGYFAENTLAGSRLNTNLADLAASITVVTKQQLEDTASVDINDVFRYEANTEGSSTYTPTVLDRGTFKDTVSGYSLGNDGGTTTNSQSNRVRGMAAPDASVNYYPSNSRIPFDSYNTGSVEISRGPNSLLFGLGSPAGIVNQTTAQATLNRDTNSVQLRTDQYGSRRGSLAINRSLIEDKLALYVAAVYSDQRFAREPASDLTRRQYAALTYKPFSKTTIRAFAENYRNRANRPNSITPRDFVTPWLQAGRPTYDPVTRMVTVLDTGRVVGPYTNNTLSPGYVPGNLTGTGAVGAVTSPQYVPGIIFDATRPLQRIDGDNAVDFFQRMSPLFVSAWTNPAQTAPTPANQGWVPQDPRYLIWDRNWSGSSNLPAPTVVRNGVTYTQNYQFPGVSNQSIYDWTKYNTNQMNFGHLRAGNYNFEIEQQITQDLFFSAGWFRQDIDSSENYTMSQLTGATLTIDTNTKMINGAANPYFGLPYLAELSPDTFYQPQTDDNYRAMLAYDLDFKKFDSKWLSWLGRHRVLGMWSKQEVNRATERWRLGFHSGDAEGRLRYLPNPLLNNGWNIWNQTLERRYYLASPGDPQAQVSHSGGFYGNQGWQSPYNTQVEVYDYAAGRFKNVSMSELIHFSDAGSFKSQREVETLNGALQSYLWGDRIISTLGWRHDDYRSRRTSTGALQNADGTQAAPALTAVQLYDPLTGEPNRNVVMNRWNRYDELQGDTKTLGVAFRPLKGWSFVERPASEGSLLGDFLRGLTFYYNQSDNFNPPTTFQTDYFGKSLAKPTGEGKDIGVGFSLLNNKLVARVSWFETENKDERTGAAGTLLTRLAYGDTTLMRPWAETVTRIRNGADVTVTNWNSEAVNPVADAANQQKVWDLMKLPVNYYASVNSPGATQNSQAKGVELQLTYNPTNNWTIKLTGGKQETTYTNVAPQYDEWSAVRMPVWLAATATDIADFTDGSGRRYSLRNFWNSYGYTTAARDDNTDGNTSASAYFNNTVVSQVSLAKALEGVVAPNQRKYRASLVSNYTFNSGKLRGFSFGGGQRYESKAAIGFLGRAADPALPTLLNAADPTKPVYLDDGNFYTDLWLSYSRKIFRDKVRMKVQLNVRDVFEDGGLLPVAINYDGIPWAFRIVDSRQFQLTTSFDF